MIYKSKDYEYKLIKQIAKGESGITSLVERDDKKLFVLKELKISNTERWTIVERFKKEIEILKTINHKGIPKFVDIIDNTETLAYIQEYIEGKTLKQLIEEHNIPNDKDFKNYLLQFLDILKYLHNMIPPIIHQDISPKNIIIKDKQVYLIDFGSVKTTIGEKGQSLTTVGTFGYMAPEQIMGNTKTQSDIYSTGITFLAFKNAIKASNFPLDKNTGEINKNKLLKSINSPIKEALEATINKNLNKRTKKVEETIASIINKNNTIKIKKKFYKKFYFIIPSLIFLYFFIAYIDYSLPDKNEVSRLNRNVRFLAK